MKDKISFAEWSFISLFCGAMLGIGIASLPPIHTIKFLHRPQNISPSVDVYVSGAVEKPGSYQLPNGSTIRAAVALAGLKEDAATDNIKLNNRLRQGQTIKISKKRKKRDSFVVQKSAV